jgi:mannose-6-phosphate isomerase-like protein (cupin superfamily)
MPIIETQDMLVGRPLPGWTGYFFHAQAMTFARWVIEAGAAPLHEHHHVQEEVWNLLEGELAISIEGVERVIRAGEAAIVPPDTPHSVRPIGACVALVVDNPRRDQLPGMG